jgi:hypothetical protein
MRRKMFAVVSVLILATIASAGAVSARPGAMSPTITETRAGPMTAQANSVTGILNQLPLMSWWDWATQKAGTVWNWAKPIRIANTAITVAQGFHRGMAETWAAPATTTFHQRQAAAVAAQVTVPAPSTFAAVKSFPTALTTVVSHAAGTLAGNTLRTVGILPPTPAQIHETLARTMK